MANNFESGNCMATYWYMAWKYRRIPFVGIGVFYIDYIGKSDRLPSKIQIKSQQNHIQIFFIDNDKFSLGSVLLWAYNGIA